MTIKELHNRSLELADLAFINKMKGNSDQAIEYFQQAYGFERDAVGLALDKNVSEPTRSILIKSAAALAFNSGFNRESEKLVALGLAGDPPLEIAEELRNLLENINFDRHLRTSGLHIAATELQMVIAGSAVAYGMAKFNEVNDRINTIENLAIRTAERRLKRPFREGGKANKLIRSNFESYISVPRAASLAFTIRMGASESQQYLFEDSEVQASIIEEILENITLINDGQEEKVRQAINDPAYFRNFVALTKELAPDGKEINLVGMTIIRNGQEKQAKITKTKEDIVLGIPDEELKVVEGKTLEVIELAGRLSAADSEKSSLKISTEKGKKYNVIVPEGLGDIVKKYWDDDVRIKGRMLSETAISLFQIDKA